MKRTLIIGTLALFSMTSCKKNIRGVVENNIKKETPAAVTTNDFIRYTIQKGQQFCDKNFLTTVKYEQLSFVVKFDSSAIYKTVSSGNQRDINKLFGFSDNNKQHHEFSARFGWRWSDKAVRLFGYIYNNGVMSHKELGVVAIGNENECSIKVSGNTYTFFLNGTATTMPRASTTVNAEGYKLYPYFGGDEMAPHPITIWIKEK